MEDCLTYNRTILQKAPDPCAGSHTGLTGVCS